MRLFATLIILAHLLSMTASVSTMSLDDCKKSLITEYKERIRGVSKEVLCDFGLKIEDFDNLSPEIIEDLRHAQVHLIKDIVQRYTSVRSQEHALDIIRNCAYSLLAPFGFDKVEILHDREFGLLSVAVMYSDLTGVAYIILNANLYEQDLETLEALLRHEVSHLIYNDTLQEDMMVHFIWKNTQEVSKQRIVEKLYPFARICETRADVYAAVHAPDHGEQLIKSFKKVADEPAPPTHPKTADRLILLESIKARLDQADKQKIPHLMTVDDFR